MKLNVILSLVIGFALVGCSSKPAEETAPPAPIDVVQPEPVSAFSPAPEVTTPPPKKAKSKKAQAKSKKKSVQTK